MSTADQDAGRLTPASRTRSSTSASSASSATSTAPTSPASTSGRSTSRRPTLRGDAMLHDTGQVNVRDRATTQMMARTDMMLGNTAVTVNKVLGAKPGGVVRKVIEKAAGIDMSALSPGNGSRRGAAPRCASASARARSPCSRRAWSSTRRRRSGRTWSRSTQQRHRGRSDRRRLLRGAVAAQRVPRALRQGRRKETSRRSWPRCARYRHRRSPAYVRVHPEEGLPRLRAGLRRWSSSPSTPSTPRSTS